MKSYKTELKWALAFVAVSLLWMLGEKLTGLHDQNISKHYMVTNFFALPAIAVYVFALRDKRQNHYNGSMSYKQGLICGLMITAIVTLISPLTQYITVELISPQFFENMVKHAVSTGAMSQAQAEKYFKLESYIVQGLIGTPVMGILTTTVVALFTKSNKKSSESSGAVLEPVS